MTKKLLVAMTLLTLGTQVQAVQQRQRGDSAQHAIPLAVGAKVMKHACSAASCGPNASTYSANKNFSMTTKTRGTQTYYTFTAVKAGNGTITENIPGDNGIPPVTHYNIQHLVRMGG